MTDFISNLLYDFLIAFGVTFGASIFAGLGAIINDHPPLKTMLNVASSIKIWAVAVALGGTFTSFQVIEKGLLKGEFRSVIKQIIYILIALTGANLAYSLIKMIQRSSKLWLE
ncbi:YtrH family sporulation protein [Thermohalobacter berrensis]|uniref:Sporulation protein n=1 Tax=Thermohalobacter berrensis TaxID=99594 RepID=A0A419T6Q9_9FIRM|nr:YtrH family sporulation protein [Thermohalobacter berrensis]RKD33161.1 sporulation protein [Thermohalobacter berrensis]